MYVKNVKWYFPYLLLYLCIKKTHCPPLDGSRFFSILGETTPKSLEEPDCVFHQLNFYYVSIFSDVFWLFCDLLAVLQLIGKSHPVPVVPVLESEQKEADPKPMRKIKTGFSFITKLCNVVIFLLNQNKSGDDFVFLYQEILLLSLYLKMVILCLFCNLAECINILMSDTRPVSVSQLLHVLLLWNIWFVLQA